MSKKNNTTWYAVALVINAAIFALDRFAHLGVLPLLVAAGSVVAVLARRYSLNGVVVGLLTGAAGLAVLELLDAGALPAIRI